LRILRPFIEKQFEGLVIYICCPDDSLYLLKDQKRTFPKSRMNEFREDISYIRIIEDCSDYHPIEELIKESGLVIPAVPVSERKIDSKKCALLTNGVGSVRSLTGKQILELEEYFTKKNFQVFINPKLEEILENFEIAVGVENISLYESAYGGLKTYLVPTGNGKNLFNSMFPNNEIIRLENKVNI
jgi:hypothetical protein